MTAHVAEAAEGRGRVILRFASWAPSDAAIRAAMLVAQAYHSEVEMLFVEDSQRVDFAGFPFAKEYSLRGGAARPVSALAVRAEMRGTFASARKRVAVAAAECEVPVYEHVVRDDPVQALVSACARRGPWNVIAIAESFGSPAPFSLDEVFETVTDATGVIIAGPAASGGGMTAGPVVLAVEDSGHLQGMLRAGRHLAAALESNIVVLLIAGTPDDLAQLDGEVRLVLSGESGIQLARTGVTHGNPAAIAEVIRRLGGSFLIAQYGGSTAPRRKSLRHLTGTLSCPVLLVR